VALGVRLRCGRRCEPKRKCGLQRCRRRYQFEIFPGHFFFFAFFERRLGCATRGLESSRRRFSGATSRRRFAATLAAAAAPLCGAASRRRFAAPSAREIDGKKNLEKSKKTNRTKFKKKRVVVLVKEKRRRFAAPL